MFTKGIKGTNKWCPDVSLQILRFYLGVWARHSSCIIIQLKTESSGWLVEVCSAVERGLWLEIAWLRVEVEALVKPDEEKYFIYLGGKGYTSDLTMDMTYQ